MGITFEPQMKSSSSIRNQLKSPESILKELFDFVEDGVGKGKALVWCSFEGTDGLGRYAGFKYLDESLYDAHETLVWKDTRNVLRVDFMDVKYDAETGDLEK